VRAEVSGNFRQIIFSHPRVIAQGVRHSAPFRFPRRLPDFPVRKGPGPVEGPLSLLGDSTQRQIFICLQSVPKEIPRLQGQRGAVPLGDAAERFIQGALEDYIDPRILGRHNGRSVAQVPHSSPTPYGLFAARAAGAGRDPVHFEE